MRPFSKNRFQKLAGLLEGYESRQPSREDEEEDLAKSKQEPENNRNQNESAFHFAKHDFEKEIVDKHLAGMINDLASSSDLTREDKEEVFQDLRNMIFNYLRQVKL